jgi:1-deoxy-D-xylulose-5-phosphate reductoisomerase
LKRVIVLGSTGSIGTSALGIIKNNRTDFELVAISANTNEKEILNQSNFFNVKNMALSGKTPESDKINFYGPDSIIHLIEETDADIVVNGISGAVGMAPSVATLKTGKDLALANKETMVLAGPLIRDLADLHGCRILPVDSEHSALFFLLEGKKRQLINEIIITASGGPFRGYNGEQLKNVTAAQAMKHPTWDMGYKISIDSATLANKGLEVLEAWRLFDISLNKIKVLIHPQSYVHSLVRTADMAMYAQISNPDMRLPIQNALYYPGMKAVPSTFLDLAGKNLSFSEPDIKNFPMLPLAYEAAESERSYPIVYNAVNEVAVQAFVDGKIQFMEIPEITKELLEKDWTVEVHSFSEVLQIDKKARLQAEEVINGRK